MSNRAPVTTEDTAGAPAPLDPGSLVAGTTPGYYRIAASAIAGISAFGASFIAAADAAAAKLLLLLTKSDVGLSNVDNTSDVNKPVSTAQNAADLLRVLKAGDTMAGGLVVQAGGVTDNTLTSGRLTFAGASGRLVDDSRLLWDNTFKFLSVGATYKFVTLGDQPVNGDLPANHALMGSTLGSLCFFAATTTGGAAYKVVCGYYNGSAIKSAWEINNTTGGTAGTLQLMKGGGTVTVGGLTAGNQVWAGTSGALTTTPPAGSAGNYKRQFMFMGG